MAIRVGIFGYGNLGRGVEAAIGQNPDMELVAVFTRRDPSALKIKTKGVAVLSADRACDEDVKKLIDFMATHSPSPDSVGISLPESLRTRNRRGIGFARCLCNTKAKLVIKTER